MPAFRRRSLVAGVFAAAAAGRAAAQPAELRIGALYPVSGPLALPGDESFRGLELAAEERNAAGGVAGRQVRLLRGDASDATQAIAEARRLMGAERAVALFGTHASTLSFAATQATEVQGIPYFELGATADSITARGFRNLWRACPRASEVASVGIAGVAEALAPAWGVEPRALRLAILHEDALDGQAVADFQQEEIRSRGLQLATRIGYAARSADFGPVVQRLRAAQADVLLHAGVQDDILLLFRGMEEAGWRPRMVMGAGGGYAYADTARAVGPGFEGALNVDVAPVAVAEAAAPGAAAFVEAYRRRYGAEPRSGHSLSNYAGARICLDALHRAGGADRDRLRAAMLAIDIPKGATPAGWGARFDDTGQNQRARPVVAQWQDGRLVTVRPEAAAVAALRPRLGGA